jgi:hypothetical protein
MGNDPNNANNAVDLENVQPHESEAPTPAVEPLEVPSTPPVESAMPMPDAIPEVTADQTPQLQPTAPLPIQEPKKGKGKLIAIIIAVVVLLGAGGAAAYYYLVPGKSQSEAAATTSPSPAASKTPTPSLTAATLVPDVKAALKSSAVTLTYKTGSWEAPDGTVVAGLPTYTMKGYDFLTAANKGVGAGVSSKTADKAAIDADYAAAGDLLQAKGLKIKGSPSVYESGDKGSIYASDDIVCSLEVMYALRGYNYLGVACGDMADYAAGYKVAKQFYDPYIAANPNQKTNSDGQAPLTFGQPEIKDGIDGYKNAWVNITRMTGAAGLFYQEPGKDWKYFTGTQQDLECTQYDTTVLKKAFAGTQCFDAAGNQSTVKA